MFRAQITLLLAFGLTVAVAGCAYPRRSTSLSPAPDAANAGVSVPDDVWHFEFKSARIPPRDRGGHAWDDEDGPDPFIRLYRGDELVWQSEPVHNSLAPDFSAELPRNFYAPQDQPIRIELWDADVSNHIIGVWQGRGLPPNALPDADVTITLDGDASVMFRISRPVAHRGIGITTYESRGSSLRVVEVERFSPAGRAGIEPGDDIVEIGEETVDELGAAHAASALSLAMDQQEPLVVEREGQRRTVTLDRDLVWLSM